MRTRKIEAARAAYLKALAKTWSDDLAARAAEAKARAKAKAARANHEAAERKAWSNYLAARTLAEAARAKTERDRKVP